MKVRISLTLDVDPQMWELLYGVAQPEMRGDVQDYVRNLVGETFIEHGTGRVLP